MADPASEGNDQELETGREVEAEKTEDRLRPLSTEDVQETDIFIGNLRPDVAPKILINRIQDLFLGEGVVVKENHFKCIHKGTKRPKHLFVRLESIEDKLKVIDRFDGYLDINVSMDGKTLKVKSRLNKKLKTVPVKSPEPPKVIQVPPLKGLTLKTPITSISAPSVFTNSTLTTDDSGIILKNPSPAGSGCLFVGQILQSEDRNTEYKSGTGCYLNKTLVRHVRKYACAFLNSEGGRLCVGVSDDCVVHGIPCNRKQEDTARVLIDNVIKRFHPPVFPNLYTVTFVPVQDLSSSVQPEEEGDAPLKVLEIKVKKAPNPSSLYENDKGEVYIRRDGSIQGPLKASQIMEWCRIRYLNERKSDGKKPQQGFSSLSLNLEESRSMASILSNQSESLKDQLKRKAEQLYEKEQELIRMEHMVSMRQCEIEKQLAALKETEQQSERITKHNSGSKKSERPEKKRPSSAVCIVV